MPDRGLVNIAGRDVACQSSINGDPILRGFFSSSRGPSGGVDRERLVQVRSLKMKKVIPEPRSLPGCSGRLRGCFADDESLLHARSRRRSPGHRFGHPSAKVSRMSSPQSHRGRMNKCRNTSSVAPEITQNLATSKPHRTKVNPRGPRPPQRTPPSRPHAPRQDAEPTHIMPNDNQNRNIRFRPR